MLLPLSKCLVHCAKDEPNSDILLPRRRTQGDEKTHALWAWLV